MQPGADGHYKLVPSNRDDHSSNSGDKYDSGGKELEVNDTVHSLLNENPLTILRRRLVMMFRKDKQK